MAILVEGSIVQLKAFQEVDGANVLNIFYYRCTDINNDVGVSNVCQEFDDHVGNTWDDLMTDSWSMSIIEGKELTPGANIGSFVSNRVGQLVRTPDEWLPSWVCAQIKFPRKDATIRSGFSRFAGLAEEFVDGQNLELGYAASFTNLAQQLSTPMSVTSSVGSLTATPITLGRKKVDGKYVFDFFRFAVRDNAQVMARVASQVSRKMP